MKKKKQRKSFSNWRGGAFVLTFPNGNQLSTTFAAGSYSENHDLKGYGSWYHLDSENPIESNTVEIMIIKAPKKLIDKIHKKYSEPNNTVIGYLTMKEWLDIVHLLSTSKRK